MVLVNDILHLLHLSVAVPVISGCIGQLYAAFCVLSAFGVVAWAKLVRLINAAMNSMIAFFIGVVLFYENDEKMTD